MPYGNNPQGSGSALGSLDAGWAIYNDGDTSPIPYGGQEVPLNLNVTNTGGNADETYLPNGVTSLWNSQTNAFNFSELSVGDMVDIEFEVQLTTGSNGQFISVNFVSGATRKLVVFLPTGPSGTYTFPYKFSVPVYQGMIATPPQLMIVATGTGAVKTNSIYARVIKKESAATPPTEYAAYVGFSETDEPTTEEIEASEGIEGPIDMSSFIFSGNRTENTPKHPFIAWPIGDFDSNQVNEGGLVNTWKKTGASLPSGNINVMSSETTTTASTFTVDGLVPADNTLWTPKFNGSQYVGLTASPYDDNMQIEVKAFIPSSEIPGDMVLMSDGDRGLSYIQRSTTWKFSLRSDYDFGGSTGVAEIPFPPVGGYFTIIASRVDGTVTINVSGSSGTGAINSTASVEGDWLRIGAHIDGVLKGMKGQIHEVKFTNLSAPAPVITYTLLAQSATKPNTETVNGRPMVGFPDGDRWEMVRTK